MGYSPTGDLGAIMKKTIGLELGQMGDHLDEEFRWRYGIGCMTMKPRLDTFYKAAKNSSSTGATFTPGYERYEKFFNVYAFGGYDYIRENDKKYKVYPGFDILGGVYSYTLQKKFYNSIDNAKNKDIYGGIRLRIGFLYEVTEKLNLHLELGRTYNYLYSPQYFWSGNEIGINIQYYY